MAATVETATGSSPTAPDADGKLRITGLRVVQAGIIAVIVVSLPLAGVAVFVFDAQRNGAGDSVSIVFFGALVLLLSTPWWPVPSERNRSNFERLQSMVLIWFGVTFTTHVTWELGWLVFRGAIQSAPDAVWSYPWWAYIDGGDARYAGNEPILVMLETLSVLNGIVGLSALWIRYRSGGRSGVAILMLMATGVVHLYSTAVYFGTEILAGYPSVDTGSFVDFVIKFWMLNAIWLVMPWLVFYWGYRTLRDMSAAQTTSAISEGAGDAHSN